MRRRKGSRGKRQEIPFKKLLYAVIGRKEEEEEEEEGEKVVVGYTK